MVKALQHLGGGRLSEVILADGGEIASNPPIASGVDYYRSNISRYQANGNQGVLASGRMQLMAIWLESGEIVKRMGFMSATTAATVLLNQWAAVYDTNFNLLAQSDDLTTAAWAASTWKGFPFTTQYAAPSSAWYYAALMVRGTTMPTLAGMGVLASMSALSPVLCGTSTTGLTTTAPSIATTPTAVAVCPYVAVASS